MEISIKWNICRVCLQEEKKDTKNGDSGRDNHFVNLFNDNKKLPLLIFELSGISMKPNDCLPEQICNKCVTIVNNAVQFRKNCRSSNSYLHSLLERTTSASSLFKPDISATEIKENYLYSGEAENQLLVSEDNVDKQNENVTVTDDTQTSHSLYYDQEDEIERELNDNISDYTVELEEIIDMSEEDQLYTETIVAKEDNLSPKSNNVKQIISDNSSIKRSEISQLQRFYMNAGLSKHKNSEEEPYNYNGNESDFLYQENTKFDSNNSDKDLNEEEELVLEKDMEFIAFDEADNTENAIDESTASDLEEELYNNEDGAQVSSTVDTTEEMESYEDNSNISNLYSALDKQDLTNETVSKRIITISKPTEKPNATLLHNKNILHKPLSIERSKSPMVLSKRKKKRSFLKTGAYESVEVCVCEVCGNRFTNQNQMKLHMKIHLQHKNHQCELCFKRFITACNLQAHMRIHTGEKPFECKYCGRRFNDRSSHIRHERTHTNEKPFECFNCGKSFSLATTLQNHMKVHSDERSYRCEPCGKSFKLPHHLKKHQSTTLHRSVLQIEDDES